MGTVLGTLLGMWFAFSIGAAVGGDTVGILVALAAFLFSKGES